MGSKHKLLPWLASIFSRLDFETAEDPFCGTASVAYLLKSLDKQVHAADFLNLGATVAEALVANSRQTLSDREVEMLQGSPAKHRGFIASTFDGIFFTREDLQFLDLVWSNLSLLRGTGKRSLALTALMRSCMKRQPRGVFTVANDHDGSWRYDDGRRDLQLSIREHFVEQVGVLNSLVFDNGRRNSAARRDVFGNRGSRQPPDLVYLDPPYVPRADDNCYIKRYHFLEGLSCYWEGVRILGASKVRKIAKPFTPFSYRQHALAAFRRLFARYRRSTIVLSYSDNGYPDRSVIASLLGEFKSAVTVHERAHRYHFGTHANVSRAETTEYVLVGTDR